jgi:hypothetical protein
MSQFIAIGAERLQLALIRRAGGALNGVPPPAAATRERYLTSMSAEAVAVLTNAREKEFVNDGDRPPVFVWMFIAPKYQLAAAEAVKLAADGVKGIEASADGCVELSRKRRGPRGMFSGDFYMLDATEAWRRFVVLDLDRAITTALLTGQTSSPCRSVVITARDDGGIRTVDAKGLPVESESVISVPSSVTAKLKR